MSQRVKLYVQKYIEGDPTIKAGLQRGLITSRILTKHIIEEEREFKGSFDDVRNAVRKYSDESVPSFDMRNVYQAFRNSYIDVISKLAAIEISGEGSMERTMQLAEELSKNNDRFIRVSNNGKTAILIVKGDEAEKIKNMVKKEDIVSVKDDICSITIHLDPIVKDVPGVYFLIMGQISQNDINIYDVRSYKSEFTLYVEQKDGAMVHQILHELSEYQKRFCSPKEKISAKY